MYENIYTNNLDYGGTLEKQFSEDMNHSNGISIASGYFGSSQISDFKDRLIKIGKNGTCRILFGMVYHRGVREDQLKALNSLDSALRSDNPKNGIYISRKEYHGKIYKIESNKKDCVYIGSSNFSSHGFKKRDECTIKVTDEDTAFGISNYINYLFNRDTTSPLSKVDLNRNRPSTSTKQTLDDCEIKSDEYPHTKTVIGTCSIELRVDDQPASSLNLFFDKGRKNQNGQYSPRPWYEVELTSTSKERKSNFYPKSELIDADGGKKSRSGEFIAYIKNKNKYYRVHMAVHADGGKNISSSKKSGGRSTLGQLIKGNLENAGVLKKNERITSEILNDYGKNYIEFKKLNDNEYIIEF